ncbi:MAG TPA: serine hydrolase [Candidatus Acidoferrales bacterium]|nr:serine hydrolase [Candidatus Acidoferrales bacterium]
MKKALPCGLAVVSVAVALLGCNATGSGTPPVSGAALRVAAASCVRSVPNPLPSPVASAFAAGIAEVKGVPGIAIALISQGKTYQYYTGYAETASRTCVTPKTIMELGSLTKTFTAALLAMDYGKHGIAPNTNPAKWIDTLHAGNRVGPGCPAPPRPTPVPASAYGVMATMTLSMLATHTSGLPSVPAASETLAERPCYSANELVNFVETYPSPLPAPTPPHPYLYSNIGFGTLGYVLQGIHGQPWFKQVTDVLLVPLGMTHTYDVEDVPQKNYAQGYNCSGTAPVEHWPLDAWPAAGTLRSTLPDMTRYLAAAMQVSGTPATIAAAMARAEKPGGHVFTSGGDAQAMAWAVRAAPPYLVWKDGGTDGFNTYIAVVAAASGTPQSGVVVLTNRAPVAANPGPSCAPYAGSPADAIGFRVLDDIAGPSSRTAKR